MFWRLKAGHPRGSSGMQSANWLAGTRLAFGST